MFHIRAQNAALVLRKGAEAITFEAFEISPMNEAVMTSPGKLLCSYPCPAAVDVPFETATNSDFIDNLTSFILELDSESLDSKPKTDKAGVPSDEERDTADPRHILLLMSILLGVGVESQHVKRIVKRIADDVCYEDAYKPWRRSPLWLVIRVATQTSVEPLQTYKSFMIFFQSQLLRLFSQHNFRSDLLSFCRKKTARRALKLSTDTPAFVLDEMTDVNHIIEEQLQARWRHAQELHSGIPSWTPHREAFENDTIMSLRNSGVYLTEALQADSDVEADSSFRPTHHPRLHNISDFHAFCPKTLSTAIEKEPFIALADFESVVHERLDAWVSLHGEDTKACPALASCLDQYVASAILHYRDSPEDESLMLLTVMELWVALDTITVHQLPLLREYAPEIRPGFLDSLLLRHSLPIERANVVERYLRHREDQATISQSIFSDDATPNAFSVRYYNQSPHLRNLKATIEKDAAEVRVKKLQELVKMNSDRDSLVDKVDGLMHEYWEDRRGGYDHSGWCNKCRVQREIEALEIEVHEWPLPSNTLDAQQAIFELRPPSVFTIWRDHTYQIIRDLGMRHLPSSPGKQHALVQSYQSLQRWSAQSGSRITIASCSKSFQHQTHYRIAKIPSTEDKVRKPNSLQFHLFDTERHEWVRNPFSKSNLTQHCILSISSESPYSSLQRFVEKTTHTQNEVIASQGDCPIELSLHEYLAFGSLRSGPFLQWLNIARELRADVLSFHREEVHVLVTQAAWHIGPLGEQSDDGRRVWHRELEDTSFGLVLTRECQALLSRIKSNWLEGVSVRTLSKIYSLCFGRITLIVGIVISCAHESPPYICKGRDSA